MDAAESSSPARDAATLAFYQQEAPAYVAAAKEGGSRWLDAFMAMLPPGARVLELGCGGGRDAKVLMAHGFDVCAIDGTPAIAALASARLGREVRVMRFDELAEVSAFDGIWANASLLHVPRAALPDVLARIFQALKPGGVHAASYKGGGTPGRDRFGRYFNFFDAASLAAVYAASARWEMTSITEQTGGGYDGVQRPWFALSARRPTA